MAQAETAATGRKPSGSTRAWGAMVSGVAAVLGIGFAWFFWHATARSTELHAHYDREAARAAGQVAARWETVVKRLAPLAEPRNAHIPLETSSPDDIVQFAPCPPSIPAQSLLQRGSQGLVLHVRGDRCAKISFATLLDGPRTSFNGRRDHARRFDQVFLADAEDSVLAAERTAPQLQANRIEFVDDKESPRQHAQLGTTRYRVFARAVPRPSDAPTALPVLSIYGLVEANALLADARRVESSYALLGLFLLVMSIICLPAAKLWLIGPYVRYRRLDVGLFQLAAVVGITLSVILVLGIVARESLRAHADEQLRSVADGLASEVGSRITETALALQAFDGAYIPGPEPASEVPASPTCVARRAPPLLELPKWWNVVFAIDGRGNQRGKLFHDQETACVDVSERDYFKKLSKGRSRDLLRPMDDQAAGVLGSVEIVRSLTTGKVVLIAARPEAERIPALAGEDGSIALEVPIDDLTGQILPRGIQTAVLDARGRVMLHSDLGAVSQQFFDDLDPDDAERLRASMNGERRGSLEVNHLGVPSRLYVEPLQAGWTVIAIAPNELTDVPVRRIVLITSAFCLLVLSTGLALLLFFGGGTKQAGSDDAPALPPAAERESLGGYYEAGRNSTAPPHPLEVPLVETTLTGLVTAPATKESRAPSSFPAGLMRRASKLRWAPVSMASSLVALLGFAYAYARVGEYEVRLTLQQHALEVLRHAECDQDHACIDLTAFAPVPESDPPWLRAGILDPYVLPIVELAIPASHRLDREALRSSEEADLRSVPWTYEESHGGITLEHAGSRWHAALPRETQALADLSHAGTFLFLLALALALVWSVTRASFRRLLFTNAHPKPGAPIDLRALRKSDKRTILLYPPRELAAELRKAGMAELKEGGSPGATKAFIADAEQYFGDKAKLLELLHKHRGPLLVLCGVDWVRWFEPEQRGDLDQALRKFVVVRGPGMGAWPKLDAEKRAFAGVLWERCTAEEQRVLAQLALDGYVAPHRFNHEIVAHLRARGIVRSDRLEIAEPHFRDYVRHTARALRLQTEASTEQHESWNAIRVPLSAAVTLLLGLMAYMQPELAAIGIPVSSVAAALKPMLRALGIGTDAA